MRKALAFILLLLIGMPILLYAQEDDDDPAVEPDWDVSTADVYTMGDQTFNISLGVVFPAVFVGRGPENERRVIEQHNFKPPIGGTGSLSYNYFLTSHIFAGAEFGGMFLPTLSKSTAFIIPLGIRIGYQFVIWRFEIPITVSLGMAWHRYLNISHYSFYLKGGFSFFYRFNSEWSFGLNANWFWLPEWTRDENKKRTPARDVDGNVIDLTLAARYHF